MTVRIRRRRTQAVQQATAPDLRAQRAMRGLVKAEQDRVLPSDEELTRLAEVRPADVDRAESLWDEAQRRAGTGLEGLLSARTDEADG